MSTAIPTLDFDYILATVSGVFRLYSLLVRIGQLRFSGCTGAKNIEGYEGGEISLRTWTNAFTYFSSFTFTLNPSLRAHTYYYFNCERVLALLDHWPANLRNCSIYLCEHPALTAFQYRKGSCH